MGEQLALPWRPSEKRVNIQVLNVNTKQNKGLSQITEIWGYHGAYAQEPSEQI